MGWLAYDIWEQKQTQKIDFYLARITAMLQAQLDPKGRYHASAFLMHNENHLPAGHCDLVNASEPEVLAMWRAALPHVKFEKFKD